MAHYEICFISSKFIAPINSHVKYKSTRNMYEMQIIPAKYTLTNNNSKHRNNNNRNVQRSFRMKYISSLYNFV